MNSPTVSVVVPVRDGATYLDDALASVLGQTRPPTEVIVVDDGSEDATAMQLARYGPPVRVIRQSRLGFGAALNRGVESVTGDLVAFCDADDLWAPGRQDRQLAGLAQRPECAGVRGLVQQFVSPDTPDMTERLRFDEQPQRADVLGSLLLRRTDMERVGSFDPSSPVPTVDWIARLRHLGLKLATVEVVVLLRRLHGQNLTIVQREETRRGLLRALRDQRRRHRAGPSR